MKDCMRACTRDGGKEHCQHYEDGYTCCDCGLQSATKTTPKPYVWEAWVGQRVASVETLPDGTLRIVLENGRGITLARESKISYFQTPEAA